MAPVEEVPAAAPEADLAAAPAAGSGGGVPADALAVPMAAGDIPWTSELQNEVACFCANVILSKIHVQPLEDRSQFKSEQATI